MQGEGKAQVWRKSLKMQDQKRIMNEARSLWRKRGRDPSCPDTEEEQLFREQKRKGKMHEGAEEF